MANNMFKNKLKGTSNEILNAGKEIPDIAVKNEKKEKAVNIGQIPSYIKAPDYNLWEYMKPDKAKKGDKYQLNITMSEETLKKSRALEAKLGCNRKEVSIIPEKAVQLFYDIVFLLNDSDLLEKSTAEIIDRLTEQKNTSVGE